LKWGDKGQKKKKITAGKNDVGRRQRRKLRNAVIKIRSTDIRIRRKRSKRERKQMRK
jgi:hypothetical protein